MLTSPPRRSKFDNLIIRKLKFLENIMKMVKRLNHNYFLMVRITYKMMVKRKIRIPEIARLSSKGQIVIPKVIRDALKLEPGMPLAVDVSRGMIIMKPIRSPIEEEDLRVLEEVGKAWNEIERGEYRRAKVEDFLREIKKW